MGLSSKLVVAFAATLFFWDPSPEPPSPEPRPAAEAAADEPVLRWEGSEGTLESLSFYPTAAEAGGVECRSSRFRVILDEDSRGGPSFRVVFESFDAYTGERKDSVGPLILRPAAVADHLESDWILLAAGYDQRLEPQVRGKALLAGLGDRVVARVRRGGGESQVFEIRVGAEDGERAVLRVPVRVTVLGDPPAVGGTEDGARRIVRRQLEDINRVFAPCHITVGDPGAVEVEMMGRPPGSVLAVGELHGLPSAGGEISFLVDEERVGPLRIGGGFTPEETARRIAGELIARGFRSEIRVLAERDEDAFPAADVLVRAGDGALVDIRPVDGRPLTTDPMQSLGVARVRMGDGLDVYGKGRISTGTSEERALVHAVSSRRSGVRELVVVGAFNAPEKQGESLLADGAGGGTDVAVVDARAVSSVDDSHTLAHELGHLLLGTLEHPDSHGEPDPRRLMSSRGSAAVDGPVRLTDEECRTMRARLSGEEAL